MPPGIRFVDVLEHALGANACDTPPSNERRDRGNPFRAVIHTPLYNLHTLTQDAGVARVVARAYVESSRPGVSAKRHDAATDVKTPEPHFVTPPLSAARTGRPRRRLTTTQSRSLDALNRFGAAIRVDFSAGELRSAFRMLARRYHPDRHPGASAADRQQLAVQFTTIRNSYEALLTVLATPGA